MARKKKKYRPVYRTGRRFIMKTKNKWIEHLMKVKEKNKKMPLKDVMKIAKKSYKK